MAKSLRNKGRTQVAARGRCDAALKAVQHFYDLGRRSQGVNKGRMKYGQVGASAARARLNPEMLRKARAFAVAYSEADLKRLFKSAINSGFALGVSHVIRLLSVPKDQRPGLQRELIEAGWSRARLDAEIRKRFGNRKAAAGRQRGVPADPADAYYAIARLCGQWQRLLLSLREQSVTKDGDAAGKQPPLRKDLTEATRSAIGDADKRMRKLSKLASKKFPVAEV